MVQLLKIRAIGQIARENLKEAINLGWFSVGIDYLYNISLKVAEDWQLTNGYSGEYCLAQIYKVRAWWTKKHEKDGRNPYSTFQSACRDDWASDRNGARASPKSNQQQAHAQEIENYQDPTWRKEHGLD